MAMIELKRERVVEASYFSLAAAQTDEFIASTSFTADSLTIRS